MCRYYENFQSFPARERAVRGNGFSLLSPISPSRAVVSLTLYDGAIPASATADIGPVKERAGIPGTAKRTAQGKGGKAGISTEPQFTRLEPVSSPANTTDDTGSSCTRGPYQVFKGMCRPDESPEQKVARPHMHEGPKFKIQYSSLVHEPGNHPVQDRSPTVFIRSIKTRVRGLSAINCKQARKMENIYQETFAAIENGANFRIDFRSRNLKVNGRHVIRDGRFDGTLGLPEYGGGDFFTDVEELYRRYKYSIPSERSQSKSRRYFMALPESDLEDGDMLYGQHRDIAQFELEFYILCRIIGGFMWNPETMGRWFWQSEKDKDLVILREWVEPGSNQLLTNSQ